VVEAHAEHKSITDAQALTEERTRKQAQEHQARYEARSVPDTLYMLLALPYILVPRNELQTTLREAKEKAAAEQRRVQEKVDTWNRQITASYARTSSPNVSGYIVAGLCGVTAFVLWCCDRSFLANLE